MGNKMKKGTKVQKRLETRRRDFAKGPQGHDRTKQQWDAGGFHAPGSNKK